MDFKLIFKSFILLSLFIVGPLSSDTQFYQTPQAEFSFLAKENKRRELQLLIDLSTNVESFGIDNKEIRDTSNTGETVEKVKVFLKKVGSGLSSLSMPIKRGIGRGFENFTSKVTGKAIPLGLGCVIFWLFWGRNNKQSIFLPITTAFKIIKPLVWQSKKEMRTDSSLRAFDTAMKHSWNWLANLFGKGVDNLVLDEETNRISMEPGFQDRIMALSFLLLANFIF